MRKILIICLVLAGCHAKQESKIILINESSIKFDSAIIFVNDYKLKTTEITPKGKLESVIPFGIVKIDPHELLLRTYLYSNNGTDTLTEFFYTDLGGSLNSKYEIGISEDRKVKILPVGY